MSGPRVPDELDELLTPSWLTQALSLRFPGIEVTAVVPGPVVKRVSTNARFRIECAGGVPAGLSANLCAKGYFGEEARPMRPVGEPEAHFYRELAEPSGVRTLRSVYAEVDPTSRHGVIITEDVVAQGAVFLDPGSDYPPDKVAESLEQLATLHAATWSKPAYESFPWLESPLPMVAAGRGVDVIERNFDGPIGAGVPESVRDATRLHRLYPVLVEQSLRAEPWAVLHGDAHVGNLFLDGAGRPGFLDWQLVHRGPWYLDVGYHMASALPVEDRRAHEVDLLRHYLDRLSSGGVDAPTFDEAWQAIRLGMVHGFYLWAITVKVNPDVTTALLERLGTAVSDHDALDAVG